MPKCNNECTDENKIYKCSVAAGNGYFCTRFPGHKGDHVACDINKHEVHVWNNECDHIIGMNDSGDIAKTIRKSQTKEFQSHWFDYCPDCGEKNNA